nr:hypothetical protein [Opitutales bacterium]
MKKKDISLETDFLSRARGVRARTMDFQSAVTTEIPGDISAFDPQKAFSCKWNWLRLIPEPENYEPGQKVTGTVSLGADDAATLKIGDFKLSVPDNYGPQGGSPYTSKSVSVDFVPGIYAVSLEYFNINYNPPSQNVARLDFSLPGEDVGEIVPVDNDPVPEKSD